MLWHRMCLTKFKTCEFLYLHFSDDSETQGSTTAHLEAHRAPAMNLASPGLSLSHHTWTYMHRQDTHTLTGTQPTTPAFQGRGVLPPEGPKPSFCLFSLEDGKS